MKSTIQLTKLRLDGGTQPRVRIDMDVVRDYAERIKAGDDFPPVDVFHDGAEHWLAEGFHRYHAYKEAGHKVVPCTIRKGTVRDAVLFSCGANGHHGLPRSTKDKRKAIETLLKDEEWGKNTDRWIADHVLVDHKTVASVRAELGNFPNSNEKRTGKDGKSYPASKPPKSKPEPAETNEPEYTCPNCQGHEADDDGDCASCHEPAEPPQPEPDAEPEGGYEPVEAKKHLDKLADLIGKAAREHAAAVKILGPSQAMGAVFSGLDTASIALTKFRAAFKRNVK